MKIDYTFLMDYIPSSPGRVSMKDLTDRAGLTDERMTRKLVLAARINGEMICADENGYFSPTTDEEIVAYYRTARARALTTLYALKKTRHRLISAGFDVKAIEGRRDGNSKEKNTEG